MIFLGIIIGVLIGFIFFRKNVIPNFSEEIRNKYKEIIKDSFEKQKNYAQILKPKTQKELDIFEKINANEKKGIDTKIEDLL